MACGGALATWHAVEQLVDMACGGAASSISRALLLPLVSLLESDHSILLELDEH